MAKTNPNPKPKKTEATDTEIICVKNTQAKVLDLPAAGNFDTRSLQPGRNRVPAAHMAAVLNNPGVKFWIDREWIVPEPGGETKPEGPDAPASLEAYKPEGAIALVEAESDPAVLRRWMENEQRQPVRAALAARLGISVPSTGGDSGSDEDSED